jgi:hypothetical protein
MVLAGTTLGSAKDNVQNKKNDEPKKKVLTLKKATQEFDCTYIIAIIKETENGPELETYSVCSQPCAPFQTPGPTVSVIIKK